MKEKRLDFELMRVIAIFLVIFNHSQERGFELYQVAGGSAVNHIVSLILAILCKIAVPLFLMISGGLLLHKDEPVRTVLWKRFFRVAAALFVFSAIQYLFRIRWEAEQTPGVMDFFSMVWGEGVSIPYWYLYAYSALMLMLPLLRPMVRSMTDSSFVYLFLLHFIYQGIIGPLGYLLGFGDFYGNIEMGQINISGNFYFPLVEQTLFYFLMGHYFARRMNWEIISKKIVSWLIVASAVAVGIMAWFTWDDFSSHGYRSQDFFESLLCIPVFTVYVLCHKLCENKPASGASGRVITTLGGCVFGAYLLEGILRVELGFIYEALAPAIHVLPACLVWVFAVGVCGLGITWILKKIPLIRKLL